MLILPRFGIRAAGFTLIPGFSTFVRRPQDLVSLKLDFYNLILDNSNPLKPRLVRKPSTTESFVVATFWPQNVAEETFAEVSTTSPPEPGPPPPPSPAPPPAPIRSILAERSRLAFLLPASVSSIPLDFDSVLQWSTWGQKVTPVARTDGPRVVSALTEPSFLETAIEVPFRLILSPSEQSHWTNATQPVTHNGWTELWHTRMDESNPERRLLRAVWDRDLSFPLYAGGDPMNPLDSPFSPFSTMDLNPIDRADIVLNTSIDIPGRAGFTSSPVKADRLMLTALGAWIDSDGKWEGTFKPHSNDLLEWRQRGTLGRDHYVKIVREGYLFPFGHPAVFVKISERKFNFNTGGQLGAYLRTRFFIVVRRPLKEYSSEAAGPLAKGEPNFGRAFPFRSVRFTTLVTPDLDPPTAPNEYVADAPEDSGELTWVARVGGNPFLFHAVATDWGGLTTEFSAGVVFVPGAVAFKADQVTVNNVITMWNGTPEGGLQDRPFDGQRVNFAEIAPKADTSLQAQVLTFGAESPAGGTSLVTLKSADQAPFYPTVSDAQVRLAAAEQVKAGQLDAPHIKIASTYIVNGFKAPNKGQIYAEIVSSPVALQFGADKSGGVMTPNLAITGLSRGCGPVGDNTTMGSGSFEPEKFFGGGNSPKILGGLELVKILATVVFGIDSDGVAEDHAPAMSSKTLFKDGLVMPDGAPPEGIHTTYHWKPKLTHDPLNIFVPDTGAPDPDDNGKAKLDIDITTDLKAPDNSTFSIEGELEHFTINLFGTDFRVLIIHFESFKFSVKSGSGLDVDVKIDKVAFDGVLKFVDELKKYLPSTGDGPSLQINSDGIKLGYSLSLPAITSGQFNLFDLKLGASMTMPFDGRPVRFRFEFCTRENPFKLTIYIFGGGGFFAVGVGTDGFEILEVALEFGVAASIDLGIAAGSAKIVVGLYFKLEEKAGPPKHQETSLTGYFRAHGEVSVMGIISISLDIYIGLSYEFDNNKVTGTATVSISVHIIFFSISASVTVERKFGGEGDPKFLDAIPDQKTWNEYASAFASLTGNDQQGNNEGQNGNGQNGNGGVNQP